MNEAETRAEHIDPALKAAGWGVVEGSRVMREYRITEGRLQGAGQRAKPEIADYVLVYRNHKLAVIEAKRLSAAYTEGLAQVKQYAGKIGARFTYATNGLRIYGMDMQSGVEGDVDAYVQEGVEELEQEKLTKLLRLRYHDSIPDAVADLGGDITEIRSLFSGFQRYLYQGIAA